MSKPLFTKFILITAGLAIAVQSLLSFQMLALAQSPSSSKNTAAKVLEVQGLAIDPFLIETEVVPGETKYYEITVTNTTESTLSFEVSINDFVTNGRNGQPLFLPATEKSDPKYSLSEWIKITQQPQFTIGPQQQTKINFSITPPVDAELGTHFGGLLFGRPKQSLSEPGTVVQNKAGTIILAKIGKAQEQGQISRFFSQHSIYQETPIDMILNFHNYGNVHSKPKGSIVIKNMFGQQVADVEVNRDALIVLPETEREFALSWSPSWAFGRYSAEAILYFGNPKLEVRAHTAFWVLPTFPILAGLCILIVLAGLGYFGIKRYNQYIINRATNDDK